MALSTEMMLRWSHLHDRRTKLSAEERREYTQILWDFMEDYAATDPERFRKEYGDPKEFLRRA